MRLFGVVPVALSALLLAGASDAAGGPPLPKGRAGECFQQRRTHPVYRVERQEIPQPPEVITRVIPAVIEQRREKVVDTPAHVVWVEVPARYATVAKVTETVGPPRTIRTKAVYRTVRVRVLARPAHLEWRRSTSAHGFDGEGAAGDEVARPTGEVICRILVPARYVQTVQRVLVTPEGTRQVPGVKHKVVCYERVLVAPAHKVAHATPATYKTICKTIVVTPSRTETVTKPRPPKIRITRVLVTPGRTVWSKIGCAPARVGAQPAQRPGLTQPAPAAPKGA